jgi:hypothetical protein
MPSGPYFRGGASLNPSRDEVRIDRLTTLLKTTRGVSVYNRPDHPNLTSHGGAYLVGPLPEGLKVIQAGRDPSHHEIVPDFPMTFEEFADLLDQITLTSI